MYGKVIKIRKKLSNQLAILKGADSSYVGMRYCAIGDSTTAGYDATTDYCLIVSNKLGMKYLNLGISGTSIATRESQIKEMCLRFKDIPKDADIITIMGGTNDAGSKVSIGSIDDRTSETFYGACHLLFGGVKSMHIGKKIGVITPLPRVTTTDGIMEKYCKVIKEVASYYELPLLDLLNFPEINPNIGDNKIKYMPDGLHPNNEGYKKIAQKVEEFIKSL